MQNLEKIEQINYIKIIEDTSELLLAQLIRVFSGISVGNSLAPSLQVHKSWAPVQAVGVGTIATYSTVKWQQELQNLNRLWRLQNGLPVAREIYNVEDLVNAIDPKTQKSKRVVFRPQIFDLEDSILAPEVSTISNFIKANHSRIRWSQWPKELSHLEVKSVLARAAYDVDNLANDEQVRLISDLSLSKLCRLPWIDSMCNYLRYIGKTDTREIYKIIISILDLLPEVKFPRISLESNINHVSIDFLNQLQDLSWLRSDFHVMLKFGGYRNGIIPSGGVGVVRIDRNFVKLLGKMKIEQQLLKLADELAKTKLTYPVDEVSRLETIKHDIFNGDIFFERFYKGSGLSLTMCKLDLESRSDKIHLSVPVAWSEQFISENYSGTATSFNYKGCIYHYGTSIIDQIWENTSFMRSPWNFYIAWDAFRCAILGVDPEMYCNEYHQDLHGVDIIKVDGNKTKQARLIIHDVTSRPPGTFPALAAKVLLSDSETKGDPIPNNFTYMQFVPLNINAKSMLQKQVEFIIKFKNFIEDKITQINIDILGIYITTEDIVLINCIIRSTDKDLVDKVVSRLRVFEWT